LSHPHHSNIMKTSPGGLALSCCFYMILAFIPLAQIWIVTEMVNAVTAIIENRIQLKEVFLLLIVQFALIILSDAIQSLNEYIIVHMKQRATYDIDKQIA